MLIQPQTNLLILKDVPLDNTYDHTIIFAGAGTQAQYFMGKMKYSRNDYTYQRVNSKQIHVDILADNLYDCNYIMFQNTAYGTKWFYAFIVEVEYINDATSRITYELDVLQTWAFDYEPDYCFVEREHSVTDNVGDNILPENVECGEYVMNGTYAPIDETLNQLGIAVLVVDTDDEITGGLMDGIYTGARLYHFDKLNRSAIDDLINQYLQKPDAIQSIYMCPNNFMEGIPIGTYVTSWTTPSYIENLGGPGTSLNGYTPKNKKLLTYPYNFYRVDNANGSSLCLRYELFDDKNVHVRINGTITQPVQMTLRPTNYKGSGTNENTSETLTISGYPMCSWAIDAYAAWLAQNSVPNFIRSAPSLVSAAPRIAMGNVGALESAVNTISNLYADKYEASIAADLSKGNISNGSVNAATGFQNFYGARCSITADYAKSIDDYFTRFGYATRALKKPNRTSRPHWNYVKTIGATITGSVPCDDLRKICQIYDMGVTFWKSGNEVGNYSLDNSPASTT